VYDYFPVYQELCVHAGVIRMAIVKIQFDETSQKAQWDPSTGKLKVADMGLPLNCEQACYGSVPTVLLADVRDLVDCSCIHHDYKTPGAAAACNRIFTLYQVEAGYRCCWRGEASVIIGGVPTTVNLEHWPWWFEGGDCAFFYQVWQSYDTIRMALWVHGDRLDFEMMLVNGTDPNRPFYHGVIVMGGQGIVETHPYACNEMAAIIPNQRDDCKEGKYSGQMCSLFGDDIWVLEVCYGGGVIISVPEA